MRKRIWPQSYALRLLYSLILALLLLAASLWFAGMLHRPPSLEEMAIAGPKHSSYPIAEGDAWLAGARGFEGFSEVASTEKYVLYLDEATSQIAVENKQTGYLWRSNPPKERIEQENVKGIQLENLHSPFILEYVFGTEIRRILTNAMDPGIRISYIRMERGIQVNYAFEKLKLSMAFQYLLTDDGFELIIPEEGLAEEGTARLFAINPLPFFGSVSGTEEEGYLFVPDGPGGLIHYDYQRPPMMKGYEFSIYGEDPALLKTSPYDPNRESIAYPVFGLKRGDEAYAAIVKEGKHHATVKAVPAGVSSSYHSISVNYMYRSEYGRRVSGLTEDTVRTVEEGRVRDDRRVEYRLLGGAAADYVGMAHAYRNYLQTDGGLRHPVQPVESMPFYLSIINGGTKPKFGGMEYEPATTFPQAEFMVNDLIEQGIRNLTLNMQGWQGGGREYSDHHFPINKGLGRAEPFLAGMKEKGVEVYFEDFMGWKHRDYSQYSIRTEGIRSIDSTALQGRFRIDAFYNPLPDFIVNPIAAIRGQKKVIDRLKQIGVAGIHYSDGPGNLLFSDYDKNSRLSRSDTAHYYEALLAYTRDALGSVSVFRGFDYSLSHTDWVESLPSEPSYDLMVDAAVPFYPIAVHGLVEYTFMPGNLSDDYELDMLKAIEYGAAPYFRLTYEPSRVLKGTDYDYVYSSEYDVWKDRIVEAYAAFEQLSSVYHLRIDGHERLREGVFATIYEDGTRVIVDYNKRAFSVEGGGRG